MDKRDMEEDGKNRNRKGWGIKIKMLFLCREIIVIYVTSVENDPLLYER
jgi:hypothetical protein